MYLKSFIYRGFETNAIKVYDVKGKNSFDISLCRYGSAIGKLFNCLKREFAMRILYKRFTLLFKANQLFIHF